MREISYDHKFRIPTLNSGVIKQLLDEVFVISRIIKVEVRPISRSRRLRLITLTETLIILDITKPNLIIVLFYMELKTK